MELKKVLENVNQYFDEKLKTHGSDAKGVDWNSNQAREIRFDQLVKIVEPDSSFSMLDYGAGYGAFYDYLIQKQNKVRCITAMTCWNPWSWKAENFTMMIPMSFSPRIYLNALRWIMSAPAAFST